MDDFADLEIRILALQEGYFPVELTLNQERQYGRGRLDAARLLEIAAGNVADPGVELFNWLLSDDAVRAAWQQIRGAHPRLRLRLRLDADALPLHPLPWESMAIVEPGGRRLLAAMAATPLSRYIAAAQDPGDAVASASLRIAALIAAPDGLADYNLTPIDVKQESDLLGAAMEGLHADLTVAPQPITVATFEEMLRQDFHVIHFVGHGLFDPDNGATLCMANADNSIAFVSEAALADIVVRVGATGTRLIFLSGCLTAARSPADAFRGLAPRLIQSGVPAVVAMQDLVSVETAHAFSSAFYRRLLHHGRVDLATNEARATLLTYQHAGAGIPALYMRLPNGQLFRPQSEENMADQPAWWDRLPQGAQSADVTNEISADNSAGDVIIATVGAGARNVAIGKNITQQIYELLGAPEADDQAVIKQRLDHLRTQLDALRPQLDSATQQMAAFQIPLLEAELSKGDDESMPSASTITQVGAWLLDHIPQLTQALFELFATPAVGKIVGRAGESAVAWVRDRFGGVSA